MKKYLSLLWILMLICGCATAGPDKFVRIKGRALKYNLPIYQGVPSAEYAYRSLGEVVGVYEETKSFYFSKHVAASICAADEDLVRRAKEMGANAVINVRMGDCSAKKYMSIGEAVIFSKLPE